MPQFIKFYLPGSSSAVHVESPDDETVVRPDSAVLEEGAEFYSPLSDIVEYARLAASEIRKLQPTRLELEIGVAISHEVGYYVARKPDQANLRIKLEWNS